MSDNEPNMSNRASLTIKRGGEETAEVFEFLSPCIVGRFDPSVGPIDLDLGSLPEGAYVSRKHAKVYLDGETWKIQDLGSSNGTYLLRDDFEKVTDADLTDGQEIALGNARFIFRVLSAATESAESSESGETTEETPVEEQSSEPAAIEPE